MPDRFEEQQGVTGALRELQDLVEAAQQTYAQKADRYHCVPGGNTARSSQGKKCQASSSPAARALHRTPLSAFSAGSVA